MGVRRGASYQAAAAAVSATAEAGKQARSARGPSQHRQKAPKPGQWSTGVRGAFLELGGVPSHATPTTHPAANPHGLRESRSSPGVPRARSFVSNGTPTNFGLASGWASGPIAGLYV